MKMLAKRGSEKATVCSNNNCITVYGRTAELINILAITAALLITVSVISKITK